MTDEKEDKKGVAEEEVLVAVDGEGEELNTSEDGLSVEAGQEDARAGASDENEDGDDDRSEIQTRRRQERKDRRNRQKKAKNRDQTELGFLRTRNEDLERRFSQVEARMGQGEVQQVDGRINQLRGQLKLADQVIAKAVTAGQGEDVVEAQGIRDQLRDQLSQVSQVKQRLSQPIQRPAQVDPALAAHAQEFMEDHPWWDPAGKDQDSLIVTAIDNALAGEGFDPLTPEYWDELRTRVEDRIPEQFNGKQPGKRPGGPTFRSGGRERSLKRNEVYISPERKQAMIDAGVWDEPELRSKYLKQYAEYDRSHATN